MKRKQYEDVIITQDVNMATVTINVNLEIHAEILGGDKTGLAYSPIILDPITNSYSGGGELITYQFHISNVVGLITPDILHNGKNSRFVAGGAGSCTVELTVIDDLGNSDTDTITITLI